MNNNRGWGLRSMLWFCAALILFFSISVFLLNKVIRQIEEDNKIEEEPKITDESVIDNTVIEDNNLSNKPITNSYSSLEDKLVISAKKYAAKYYSTLTDDNIITVVRLQTEELLEQLTMDDIECSGYIEITKTDDNVNYYPYIKCSNNYETKGYDSQFDNTGL